MILHKKHKLPPETVNTIIEIAGIPGTGKSDMANALGIIFGFPVLEFPNMSPVSFSGKALMAALKDTRAICATDQGMRWWACQSMANFLESYTELTKPNPVFVTNYYFSFKALFGYQGHSLFKECPTTSKCFVLTHNYHTDVGINQYMPFKVLRKYQESLLKNSDSRMKRVILKLPKGIKDTNRKNQELRFIVDELIKVYNYTPIREFTF